MKIKFKNSARWLVECGGGNLISKSTGRCQLSENNMAAVDQ